MQGDPNNFSIVPGGNSLHLSVREGSSPKGYLSQASGKKGRDFTCCRNHMKGLGNQVFSVCKKARKGLQMHFISLKSRKKLSGLQSLHISKTAHLQQFGRYKKSATFSLNNRVLIKGEGVGPHCGASPYKTYIIKVLLSSC